MNYAQHVINVADCQKGPTHFPNSLSPCLARIGSMFPSQLCLCWIMFQAINWTPPCPPWPPELLPASVLREIRVCEEIHPAVCALSKIAFMLNAVYYRTEKLLQEHDLTCYHRRRWGEENELCGHFWSQMGSGVTRDIKWLSQLFGHLPMGQGSPDLGISVGMAHLLTTFPSGKKGLLLAVWIQTLQTLPFCFSPFTVTYTTFYHLPGLKRSSVALR